MTILEALIQLRNDIKLWCANNFNKKLNKNLGSEENGKFLTVDANGDVSTVKVDATVDELNYMSGVKSNVQTQLDGKFDDKTADELRTYIGAVGKNVEGETFTVDEESVAAEGNAEVFNDYKKNIATGRYSHAEGSETTASGICSHAEGVNTTASGKCAHAEGGGAEASGISSHAEGTYTTASGGYSHAEGSNTTASGYQSHAEGGRTTASGDSSHAEGGSTIASGDCSHAEGGLTIASGNYSHAEGYKTEANNYQHVSGKYNTTYSGIDSSDTQDTTHSDAIFLIGYGTSTTPANAFRVSSGGKCFGAQAFGASGADFAELFEWTDGNPNNEDRRGLFVCLDGDKIKLANEGDDYIGIISGAQAFIGNSASEDWHGKYLTDVFGAKLSQEVEIPAEIDEETGKVIRPAITTIQYIVNPEYNPNEPYVMRENRKEWGIVGLLGQIVMIDDGTCKVGGYVKPSINGVGTASDSGYRVMKRVDENHIKVLVK